MNNFQELDIHASLHKALAKMGFEKPTEIQASFIPEALKGGDVMASAQTGSGKTVAFLVPAFQKLLENPDASHAHRKKRGPRVLVLTPTRELTTQVMQVAKDLQAFSDISVTSVTGGMPIMRQKKVLSGAVDVVVATPGRVLDLLNRRALHLSDVDTFILDEADRMLDMGFSEDVLKISQAVGEDRQALLLSATLDGSIAPMIKKIMNKPAKIELTHVTQRHDNITQCLYRATDNNHKQELLLELIKDQKIWQAVIFAGTKMMTKKIAKILAEKGELVDVLNGDMRQSARNTAIKRMQTGKVRFLVATDVAARGLDIKTLTHVINFDIPRQSEDYIHRIGRVGRAGRTGDAISLVSNEQWGLLKAVERLIGEEITQEVIEGMEFTPGKGKSKSKGGNSRNRKRTNGNREGTRTGSRNGSSNGNRMSSSSRNSSSSNSNRDRDASENGSVEQSGFKFPARNGRGASSSESRDGNGSRANSRNGSKSRSEGFKSKNRTTVSGSEGGSERKWSGDKPAKRNGGKSAYGKSNGENVSRNNSSGESQARNGKPSGKPTASASAKNSSWNSKSTKSKGKFTSATGKNGAGGKPPRNGSKARSLVGRIAN